MKRLRPHDRRILPNVVSVPQEQLLSKGNARKRIPFRNAGLTLHPPLCAKPVSGLWQSTELQLAS